MNIACSLTGRAFGILCSFPVPASGQTSKIEVPHEGGALGVGYIAKKPEYNTAANSKARNGSQVRSGVRRQKPRSAIKR
jgi:hypothetical protein